MEDGIFHKVSKWAHMLGREDKIGHALRRLESVEINLQILSETGVGKAVNSLRKHPEWGDQASALVLRWKEVARVETARAALTDEAAETRDDSEQVDAFSAELAAADRLPKIKGPDKKKKTKNVPISAESIQNSLLDSLANPSFAQMSNQNQILPQNRSTSDSLNFDINMFKAPKESRRVYAGKKKDGDQKNAEVPRLYDICIRFLCNNIDAIDETGDIPFHVLRPVLEKASAAQLRRMEEKNAYLQEDTEYLWKQHCEREFAKELGGMVKERGEEDGEEEGGEVRHCQEEDGLNSWHERYAVFLHQRERKLRRLSKKIKTRADELAEPQRKALVTAPIAPRHVRKRQIRHGMVVSASSLPSAIQLTRARRQIFENGNDADLRQMPSAIRNTTSTLGARVPNGDFSTALLAKKKPQRGPLMLKTLKMLKKQRR